MGLLCSVWLVPAPQSFARWAALASYLELCLPASTSIQGCKFLIFIVLLISEDITRKMPF